LEHITHDNVKDRTKGDGGTVFDIELVQMRSGEGHFAHNFVSLRLHALIEKEEGKKRSWRNGGLGNIVIRAKFGNFWRGPGMLKENRKHGGS